MQDLHLESLGLEPGEQVLARVIACIEGGPPRVLVSTPRLSADRHARLLIVLVIVARPGLTGELAQWVAHVTGHAAGDREALDALVYSGKRHPLSIDVKTAHRSHTAGGTSRACVRAAAAATLARRQASQRLGPPGAVTQPLQHLEHGGDVQDRLDGGAEVLL